MSDLRKAAEMALGVLLDPKTTANEVADAIKTIRQALAQPDEVLAEREACAKAAEAVLEAWDWDWSEPRNKALKERMEALRQALAQPEEKIHIEGNGKLTTKPYPDGYESEQQFRKALAQREWVGLTQEEVDALLWKLSVGAVDEDVRTIEAKLKEKNT